MRMLSYYEIRPETEPPSAAPTKMNAAQLATATHREAMTFTELLRNVGLFGAAVMCCLVALSIFSVAVIVDKYRRFRLASRQSQIFEPVFSKFLHGGEVQELIDAVRLHQKSHVAQVVSAGILEYDGVRKAGQSILGAKDGVQAVTIVYPIDFLPAT